MATQQPLANFRYSDLPEIREIFTDSIHTLAYDGQMLRIEFCVTRFQPQSGAAQAEAVRYPACGMVLPVAAATDLASRLVQTLTAIKDAAGAQSNPPSGQASSARAAAPRTASSG